MGQQNVEIVRTALTAVLEGDWPTALATMDPEVEVHDFDIPEAGVYRGHEGFREWLRIWSEGWDEWGIEDAEFRVASEDRVLALFKMITKGRDSRIEFERGDAVLYLLRSGKIVRLDCFNDQNAALEAAGLI